MMRKIAAATLVLASWCSTAGAADIPPEGLTTVLNLMGCAEELIRAPNVLLVVTCDEAKVIAALPMMQSTGAINKELTQFFINTHHISLTGYVTTMGVLMSLMSHYRHDNTIDALRVEGRIAEIDDYGHAAVRPAFSFGFDRAIYARINWDNFDSAKLPNVTKRYVFSPWYQGAIVKEGY